MSGFLVEKYMLALGFKMRGRLHALLILLILLAPSLGVLYSREANNSLTKHIKRVAVKHSEFFIDPQLVMNPEDRQIMLIVFRDTQSMYRGLRTLKSRAKILHKYKIIPAVLVDGKLKDIIGLSMGGKLFRGVYANKVYRLSPISGRGPGATTSETAERIGVPVFWNNGYDGTGITVCVIDSGIYSGHPELEDKVVASKSFVLRKYGYLLDEPATYDVIGHGTGVAGIIAGKGINPKGQGMAPGTKIMNARVVEIITGGQQLITLAGLIAAIEWAVYGDDGIPDTGDEADVINMSLGGLEFYNSPTWMAIERATKMGVTIVCAAGNEGREYIGSMSINDPANAPYSIAVGAVSPECDYVESYSSLGPTYGLYVKPDIVAPSGVYILSPISDGYIGPERGTSFSAPHVSGAVALVLDYISDRGVPKKYWPIIARSLLMYSASPIYQYTFEGLVKYEDLIVGAGIVNLSKAYDILESSTISGTSYPQWLTILPRKIPAGISNESSLEHQSYFPYFDRVFTNQTIVFNFSIIASRDTAIDISISGNISDALDMHSAFSIDVEAPITYWKFNFTVKSSVVEGFYCGNITFKDVNYGVKIDVPMKFKVVHPRLKVLLDLRHTSWTPDFKYGQYRFLAWRLEVVNNVSITHLLHSTKEITTDLLSGYDVLMCPDAASVEQYFYENGSFARSVVNGFSKKEIKAIRHFVGYGGSLIIFAIASVLNGAMVHNISNINELLNDTGIAFTDEYVYYGTLENPVPATTTGGHMIVRGVSQLPFSGLALNVDTIKSEVFLEYDSKALGAIYQGGAGGAIIVLGTNFLFDNWAFEGLYCGISDEQIAKFTDNIVDFLTYGIKILDRIEVSGNTSLCGEVSVKAYNMTPLEGVDYTHKNMFNITEGHATYIVGQGYWVFNTKFTIAGPNDIRVKAQHGDGYYVVRVITISVAKTENNPPKLTLEGQENYSTVDLEEIEEYLVIRITITDDTGIVRESINVSIWDIGEFEEKISGGYRKVTLEVVVPRKALEKFILTHYDWHIIIRVVCYDVNLNAGEATYVFSLKYEARMWMLIVILILIILIAVIAIIIIISRRHQPPLSS